MMSKSLQPLPRSYKIKTALLSKLKEKYCPTTNEEAEKVIEQQINQFLSTHRINYQSIHTLENTIADAIQKLKHTKSRPASPKEKVNIAQYHSEIKPKKDEWSKIAALNKRKEEEEINKKHETNKIKKAELVAELNKQLAEKKANLEKSVEENKAYDREILASALKIIDEDLEANRQRESKRKYEKQIRESQLSGISIM